jgi:hypothetical protein
MKRKATSYSDMLQTVAEVNCPELTDSERHFLLCVALNASQSGSNSYAGNVTLGKRVDRAGKTITRRWMRLVELGLMSVKPSTRKGIANEFKIELTHPAYPETHSGMDGAPGVIYGDARQNLPGVISQPATRHLPACQASFSQKSGVMYGDALSLTTSTTTTTTPSAAQLAEAPIAASSPTAAPVVVVSGDTEKPKPKQNSIDILIRRFVEKEGQGPKGVTRQYKAALAKLEAEHGTDKFLRAGAAWLRANPWNDKTTTHFAEFINNFVAYLTIAAKQVSDAQRETREAAARDRSGKAAEIAFAVIGKDRHPHFKELPAEDQAKYKAVVAKDWFAYTTDDVKFAAEIQAKINSLYEAEHVAVPDDGTPPF